MLSEAGYVHFDGDGNWWSPSGRTFFSPGSNDTAAMERAYARAHFFLPLRFRDPFYRADFNTEMRVAYDAYDLLVVNTRDALGNQTTAGERDETGNIVAPGMDYRVLQPRLVMDANRNRSEVTYDALGMMVGTAVMGKPAPGAMEGDSLVGFERDLTDAVIADYFADPLAAPQVLLGDATSRQVYDVFAYYRTRQDARPKPCATATITRETHANAPLPDGGLKFQQVLSYSDGMGREIQKKARAEPGPVPLRDATGEIVLGPDRLPVVTAQSVNPRWVGSGWTIFNNKGSVVRRYEPFFTDTHRFEFDVRIGVSPVVFYDALGRTVGTLGPDRTWEKVVYGTWRQENWDAADTVLFSDPKTDPDLGGFFERLADEEYLPTWHEARAAGALGIEEKQAAEKSALYAETKGVAHADALGRAFLSIAHNRFRYSDAPGGQPPQEEFVETRSVLDIEGNAIEVIDEKRRVAARYAYDMLGNRLWQSSMEAGQRWTLYDLGGTAVRAWNSRGHRFRNEFDTLRRPLRAFTAGVVPASPALELMTERIVYGEEHPEAETRNLRGRTFLHLDQAGVSRAEAHDFKGNLLLSVESLAAEYKQTLDWSVVEGALSPLNVAGLGGVLAPFLLPESYVKRSAYDALSRPLRVEMPDGSVLRSRFNDASFLDAVEVNLRGEQANGQLLWTTVVRNIDYDSKGQRTQIEYGNGARTTYEYDRLSYRLTRLLTRRDRVSFPGDSVQPPPAGWPGCDAQDLRYTYDVAGNVVHIEDRAQQAIYFRNRRVEPSTDYIYDALYRLIESTGREHLGQMGGAPAPHSHDDVPRVNLSHRGDGNAMGRYRERYLYDAAGNLLEMKHAGSDPAHPGWTRRYEYAETSLTEVTKVNNRLSQTSVGPSNPQTERYVYDAHGNIVRMPHLGGAHPAPNLDWDHRDQLRRVDLGGGGAVYYVYDAAGERVRKVWEKPGNLVEERIYLGGVEIFRRRQGTARLERETLHVMDDKERVAMVETRTVDTAGTDPAPARLIRYQLSNHLGSATLELDGSGQVISYEEYSAYGSTTYLAVRSQTETPKRYRFSGKERDEESGMERHGARFYLPWLGRWLSADPAGIGGGLNLFAYADGDPIGLVDTDGEAPKSPQRKYMQKQQRAFRKQHGMTGADVQAGHTATVRDTRDYGIPVEKTDRAPLQQLHSRRGQGLDVQVTDNKSGATTTNTRHTAQEKMIDTLTERSVANSKTKTLTPRAQLSNAIAHVRATENVPLDQRNVDLVRNSGPAAPSKVDANVDPKTGQVVDGPETRAALERRAAKLAAAPKPAAPKAPAPKVAPPKPPLPRPIVAPKSSGAPKSKGAGPRGAGATVFGTAGLLNLADDLVQAPDNETRLQLAESTVEGMAAAAVVSRIPVVGPFVVGTTSAAMLGWSVGNKLAERVIPDSVHVKVGATIMEDIAGINPDDLHLLQDVDITDAAVTGLGQGIVEDVFGASADDIDAIESLSIGGWHPFKP